MPVFTFTPRFRCSCRRLLAVAGVALVLLLSMSVVSPLLHDHLHGGESSVAAHTCAVVLFASGVNFALATIAIAAPRIAWRELPRVAVAELFVATPRYLRQPERGPPHA